MPTRRRFLAFLGSGAALAVAAATGVAVFKDEEEESDGFPVIRYGAESCARCGMIIDEVRFAAARSGPGKASKHFDDIGCCALDAADDIAGEEVRFFVHDYTDESWLDALGASYVIAESIRSPMAYGLAAVRDEQAAQRMAGETGGRVYSWAELPEHLPKRHSS
ncbi:MAG TPA: nitrous oxide reductase accessory protein NosL [Tepidiformaceae bacterium]